MRKMANKDGKRPALRAFLGALIRDVRANTIAIMAIALIPLAGMVGGGVDISRMYIVKTRLQHACDAGALAGRKAMGAGNWNQSNYAPRTAAEKFFDANIQADPYGASSLTRSFTESGGKVSGAASAVLPMTLMRIFGRTTETLSVVCDAEMRLPNTDVMFVLDTTGSMDQKAVATDTDTKITGLKTAVKCFFEVVAKLDTTASCSGSAPSGGVGNTVQIRFGFMPYATNVNVGKLLPTSYFANSWYYQSRKPNTTASTSTTMGPTVDSGTLSGAGSGDWGNPEVIDSRFLFCPTQPSDTSNQAGTYTYDTAPVTGAGGVVTWETRTYSRLDTRYSTGYSGWTCNLYRERRGTGNYTYVRHTQTPQTTTTQTFNNWDYGRLLKDISGLKNGTSWNNSFQADIGDNGTMKTITWDGCIEERQTSKQSSYDPIPSGAYDLNIDLVPTQGTASSLWGPALPDMIYLRNAPTTQSATSTTGWSYSPTNGTTANYRSDPSYSCPTEARKLQSWNTAYQFESYVNSMATGGNTYHDIGLLWGARFLSPTGLFSSENATTPNGGAIARHLIFMTDGDTNAINTDYAAYGVPWFDRRQTTSSSAPSNNDLNDQVNARFLALCTAVKNKNITLWVISFGSGSNASTESRLETCASDGHYYVARDSLSLQQTFSAIAGQISQLRLTK